MNRTRAEKDKPRRRFSAWALAIGCVGLVGCAALALWIWWAWGAGFDPVAGRSRDQAVRIERGTSFDALTDSLAARGLLERPLLLRLAARITGGDRQVQAGRYLVPAGLSPRDLLALLVSGRTIPVRVTIPEGVDAGEAAAIAAEALGWPAERFLAIADSLARSGIAARGLMGPARRMADHDSLMQEALATFGHRLHWSEGYLAPDTYHFAEGTGARQAATVIVATGLARADSASAMLSSQMASLGLQIHDLVTLASIVEAEARRENERGSIAAVYANRLRRGWRLEADPTVAFILRKRGQRLLYRDLRVDSPYNTYRRTGLPPGPIGCPGMAALAAAARPDSTCEAMFFVSDGEGGHVFSRTSAEHEQAVRRYREVRGSADH